MPLKVVWLQEDFLFSPASEETSFLVILLQKGVTQEQSPQAAAAHALVNLESSPMMDASIHMVLGKMEIKSTRAHLNVI